MGADIAEMTELLNRGIRGWLTILFGGLTLISLLLGLMHRQTGDPDTGTSWLIGALTFGLLSLLCWALSRAKVQRDAGYMDNRFSRRWGQVGIAALIGYIAARMVWQATGDTGTAWGCALVVAIVVYFISTRFMANSGIGPGDVVSLQIATSYHLAVVVEKYDDRVWLRLFNAGWLDRPDSFVGNELLAQDQAWQSQDYVLMNDQFMQSDPRRIGPFNGMLTSRAAA